MKKTRLKLRKQVWIFLIVIIFLGIGIYSGINISKKIAYQKTPEYKLLSRGYTKNEIKLLEEKTNQDIINTLFNKEKDTFLLELINEKYYLKNNLTRYLAYSKDNPDTSIKSVISLVNTFRDYHYYDHDIDADLLEDTLILINKYYKLPEDYTPDDLVKINNKYYYGENHKIRKIVYDAFIEMWNAAKEEDIYLIINSSYRNYASQVEVYDAYKNTNGTSFADSIAARPGHSEHQTGLALDIFSKENSNTIDFKGSASHLWLQNNAYKYGFIERYPENKEEITGFSAESWHYRYVGVEAAKYIYTNDLTFDEYYAYYLAN